MSDDRSPAEPSSEPIRQVEAVDVDAPGGRRIPLSPTSIAVLVGLAVLAVGFVYEHVQGGQIPFTSNLEPLDWLFAGSLLATVAFVVVPLATDREQTLIYWRRLRRRPAALASLGFLVVLVVVGLLGPVFVTEPRVATFGRAYQPPVGFGTETKWLFTPESCLGQVRDGLCYGTLEYPLGTTDTGKDMVPLVVLGSHTALKVAVIATALIVPVGSTVGLVAAFAGGRTDRLLMQAAELFQTVPAIVIYILFWGWNAEYRLLVLVGVFGMTSWGGLARLVRNEARQLRSRNYVRAARSAGASRVGVVRRHLLPNVSRSVLTNVTLQVPLLVFTEAALSFIVVASPFDNETVSLGDGTVVSWGTIINTGTQSASLHGGWWIATIPAVLLVATMLSLTILGRALGDVLDPRVD